MRALDRTRPPHDALKLAIQPPSNYCNDYIAADERDRQPGVSLASPFPP